MRSAAVVYTLLRLAVLGVCVLVGYLLGLHGAVLLLVALVISGVLSLFLLQRQRTAMSATVDQWLHRTRRGDAK